MSDLSLFLKKNKIEKTEQQYAATKSLCDKEGNPLLWTIKPISTDEFYGLRKLCTKEVPVPGKRGLTKEVTDAYKLNRMIMTRSIVEPNLQNAELQDSYGVKNAEDLITKMVDDPGEFNDLIMFINKISGFDTDLEAEVEEAKN